MTQPDSPQVVIIGLKEVLEEVRRVNKNQCDLATRFDVYLAAQQYRMEALEKASQRQSDELDTLRQNAVTRPAMWVAIGTLTGIGTLAVGAVALFK